MKHISATVLMQVSCEKESCESGRTVYWQKITELSTSLQDRLRNVCDDRKRILFGIMHWCYIQTVSYFLFCGHLTHWATKRKTKIICTRILSFLRILMLLGKGLKDYLAVCKMHCVLMYVVILLNSAYYPVQGNFKLDGINRCAGFENKEHRNRCWRT